MTSIRQLFASRRARAGALTLALLGAFPVAGVVRARAAAAAPMAVYLSDRDRTGTITLFNPGDRPEEIEIGFAFGYPTSDGDGNVILDLVDTPPADEPNAVPWLRAFPRRLVLGPGERQLVRVMVQPPAGIADGEYWARALVHARGGRPPIEQRQGNVGVQVNVETVVVAAVNYRHGTVGTGLEIAATDAVREGERITATVDLVRTGNAAFLGRILAQLVDERGTVLDEAEDVLAVYRGMRRRVELVAPPGAHGPLRVRWLMDTRREDLPQGGPLPVAPLEHVVTVS